MTPRATYRLQFHAGFRFTDAIAIIPYLARLGISHVYASPYLKARAGSTHGYDIVDHTALNPEIGARPDYDAFVAALRAHGMGHILDFVPNHMGVGGSDNAWWLDLLTWGPYSHYADYFDVDWEPLRPQLRGKVMLPFLGRRYGEVLDAGELRLAYADGAFALHYYEHTFPLTPPSYALLLERAKPADLRAFARLFAALDDMANHVERRDAAASLQRLLEETQGGNARALAGQLDAERTSEEGKALLDRVVQEQHWRPTSWRVAGEEINYRRFFDINGLAALRMEHAAAFADAHALVFALIERGQLDGLRLDHVDGLFDPLGYCDLLRSRAELLGQPMYLVVEKILAAHEELRARWHVDGTTGYEFMNAVTGLFVDARNEAPFTRAYERFTGDRAAFEEVALAAKRLILVTALAGERNVLALRLDRIAQQDPRTRDFTLGALTRALFNTIVAFPVYRTYVRGDEVDDEDRNHVTWAIGRAAGFDISGERDVYTFLQRVLLLETDDPAMRLRYLDFAMRFQQLTSPVAAKGVEDTAFYRSVRLVALNEVGGDPGRFGTPPAEFHRQNARRAARRPYAMLATATHDAKRGEDVRARLAVLSEMPVAWRAAIARWSRLNRRHRTTTPTGHLPAERAEYLLYQTIVGAWPIELLDGDLDPDALSAFAERVAAYLVKAAREAKQETSWANPNEAYEAALDRLVRGVLDPVRSRAFLESVRAFVSDLAPAALSNSLAQTLLKLASPGMPDTYQGAELWDLSLVDPDNRRPVDFAARERALQEMDDALARGTSRANLAVELLRAWPDGRVKLYLMATVLRHVAASADWPERGYAPLSAVGAAADHVVAFRRGDAVIVTTRLPYTLAGSALPLAELWSDAAIPLGDDAPAKYRNVLTGEVIATEQEASGRRLSLATILRSLPTAMLVPEKQDSAREQN
ncbi:MAG: malto-oligosyltrehalose synthase [Vulcanimicrobiaceae bacterium]